MSWFVVDVEADGPIPGPYSMVSFGAVRVDEELATTFFGEVAPISQAWIPGALAVSRVTREQHLAYRSPQIVMQEFATWVGLHSKGRPIFCSDNLAFDWMFTHWYFINFTGTDPFGHSGRRIGDLFAGMQRDARHSSRWRALRHTRHTHHPVDDAKGVAEALLAMGKLGLQPGW